MNILTNDIGDYNYIEIVFMPNIDDKFIIGDNEVTGLNINWPHDTFTKILNIYMHKHNRKPFEKQLTILKHNNHVLKYDDIEKKYIVESMCNTGHSLIGDNGIVLKYNKSMYPVIYFPSTDIIHDRYYVNRITFKMNNRIYVNFEIEKKKKDNGKYEIYRRIYINVNYDKPEKIDIDTTNNILNNTIENLISSL